jgi:hypothetical protein
MLRFRAVLAVQNINGLLNLLNLSGRESKLDSLSPFHERLA